MPSLLHLPDVLMHPGLKTMAQTRIRVDRGVGLDSFAAQVDQSLSSHAMNGLELYLDACLRVLAWDSYSSADAM